MINKIAEHITHSLISHRTINDDEYELYVYGLFLLISHIFFFAVTLISGLIFKRTAESALFYISFFIIRKFAGGYHAKSETLCEILSVCSIIMSIVTIRVLDLQNLTTLLLFTALASVIILLFSPLDTPEKELSGKEMLCFRNISLTILLIVLSIILISYFFNFKKITIPLCVSVILESVLLTVGKIKRRASHNYTDENYIR